MKTPIITDSWWRW